jgi:hypothetical protein
MIRNSELMIYIKSDWVFKPPTVRIWVDDYLISERVIRPNVTNGFCVVEVTTLELVPHQPYEVVVENISWQIASITVDQISIGDRDFPFNSEDGNKFTCTIKVG